MTKQHSLKKALVSSLVSIALCFTMLLGTTFAWFTDSVTSGSNIIQSGSLDIVLEYWDGTQWADAEGKVLEFIKADNSTDEVLWEPGCTYQLPKIRVRNVGTLAAYVVISLNGVTGDEKLMEVVDLTTTITNIPDSVLTGSQGSLYQQWNNATISPMYGTPDGTVIFDWNLMGSGIVSPNSGHTDTSAEFTIQGHMDEEAGNEYQNQKIEGVSITVVATQLVYEYDSFGREYDNKATLPVAKTEYVGGGETVTAGKVSVTLPDNAPMDSYTVKTDNIKEETINDETTLSLDIELKKDGVKVQEEAGKEYIVQIDLGKVAIITGVTHNGEAVTDYTFDPVTHILTFKTTSFSPFAVSYTEPTYEVGTAEELIAVLETIRTSAKTQIPSSGANNKAYRENAIIVLTNDIVVDKNTAFMYTDGNGAPFHFYGVKGVLDLNGHNITVSEDALMEGKTYANAVLLFQYSNIDIIGEGTIKANNQSMPVYAWANCTVNIYDGNYESNASERNESVVYVNNNTAMVNVYGGTYTNTAYAFNVHDNNVGTKTVLILHKGIVYTDFLKNGTTDVTKSDLDNGRIALAEGCTLVKNETTNTVE